MSINNASNRLFSRGDKKVSRFAADMIQKQNEEAAIAYTPQVNPNSGGLQMQNIGEINPIYYGNAKYATDPFVVVNFINVSNLTSSRILNFSPSFTYNINSFSSGKNRFNFTTIPSNTKPAAFSNRWTGGVNPWGYGVIMTFGQINMSDYYTTQPSVPAVYKQQLYCGPRYFIFRGPYARHVMSNRFKNVEYHAGYNTWTPWTTIFNSGNTWYAPAGGLANKQLESLRNNTVLSNHMRLDENTGYGFSPSQGFVYTHTGFVGGGGSGGGGGGSGNENVGGGLVGPSAFFSGQTTIINPGLTNPWATSGASALWSSRSYISASNSIYSVTRQQGKSVITYWYPSGIVRRNWEVNRRDDVWCLYDAWNDEMYYSPYVWIYGQTTHIPRIGWARAAAFKDSITLSIV